MVEQGVQDVPSSTNLSSSIQCPACHRYRYHAYGHSWVQDACTAFGSQPMQDAMYLPAIYIQYQVLIYTSLRTHIYVFQQTSEGLVNSEQEKEKSLHC